MAMAGLVLATVLGATGAVAAPSKVTIDLKPLNDSGESGTATLIPHGDATEIMVVLSGTPQGVVQPMHIHQGTCDHLNPTPRWPLDSVKDGKSTTRVPVALSKLLAGSYAINVHKSAAQIGTYVACGDIKPMAKASAMP